MLVSFIGFFIWGFMFAFQGGVVGERERPSPSAQVTGVVSAETLFAEYEANEVAADRKYKDKHWWVTGAVTRIGKDILGTAYVTLETGRLMSVQCMFADNEDELIALEVGDSVQVVGRCGGKLGNVIFKECRLVR